MAAGLSPEAVQLLSSTLLKEEGALDSLLPAACLGLIENLNTSLVTLSNPLKVV